MPPDFWPSFFKEYERATQLMVFNRYEQALEIFEDLITRDSYLSTEIFIRMAYIYSKLNRDDQALATGKQALTKDPNNAKAHFVLSHIHLKMNKTEHSFLSINRALQIDPDNIDYMAEKARVMYWIKNGSIGIDELLDRVQAQDPNHKLALILRCRLALRRRQLPLFNKQIMEALAVYPNDATFMHIKSTGHLLEENYEEAANFARKSLQIDPTSKATQDTLERAESAMKYVFPVGIAFALLIKIILVILRNMN